jgi:polysaccharide deacetylase 2 family uncharacterized protein YibQ
LVALLLGLTVFLAGLWLGRRDQPADVDRVAAAADREPGSDAPAVESEPVAEVEDRSAEPSPSTRADAQPDSSPDRARGLDLPRDLEGATLALVIDDLGRSVRTVDRLAQLGVPLTYAVLPFESRTEQVVTALRAAGVEYLLHLPMEGTVGANPGPGALRADMSPAELQAATERALDAVKGAAGVNNHMGSIVSADRRAMTPVIELLRDRGLFFLDSRTSPDSVGHAVAQELGVPSTSRHVFLDGDRSPAVIRQQLSEALSTAVREGSAVAIGHPYEETLAVLSEEIPGLVASGVRFVPISYLLERRVTDLDGP